MKILKDEFKHQIAFDSPGFGRSKDIKIEESIEYISLILCEAIQSMNLESILIFGHHTGSSIAVQVANNLKDKVKSVTFFGSPLLTMEAKKRIRTLAPTPVIQKDGTHLIEMWNRIISKDLNSTLDLSHRETILSLISHDNYQIAYNAVGNHDFEKVLSNLEIPVLFLTSGKDSLKNNFVSTTKVLKNPLSRYYILGPNIGTFVCDTHPLEISTLIK